MPAPPKHRQSIVDSAVTLFRRKGYSGTGLADLIEHSGAPKGSLYHYFPAGKPAIGEAAVAFAGERVVDTLVYLDRQTCSTAELLRGHAKLLGKWMKASCFTDGCPITTVLLEMAPEDKAITEAGRLAYAARQEVLASKLMRDGFSQGKSASLAVLCSSAIQGSLIQSRVERSTAPIISTAEELALLLEQGTPVPIPTQGKPENKNLQS
jgi:TetR/AcrR family transcriptional regulator, lmrAB and yxaGH operons repressor